MLSPTKSRHVRLGSPSKSERDRAKDLITQSQHAAINKLLKDQIINHISQYAGNPEVQEAILGSLHETMDNLCIENDLNRGVLISPDVAMLGSMDLDIGLEDGLAGIAAVDDSMTSAHTLAQFGIIKGDGTSVEGALVLGSHGTPTYASVSMDLSSDWVAADTTEVKTKFLTWAISQVRQVEYQFQLKHARLHPWTAFAWADMLFDALDHPGWINLSRVCRGAYKLNEHGSSAAAIAAATRLATTESDPLLKTFYTNYAQSKLLALEKNEYYYFYMSLLQYDLIESYEQLQAEFVRPGSDLAKRVVKSDRGGKGRKNKDKVKSFLAMKLGVDDNALKSSLAAARPIHAIATTLGVGFLVLLGSKSTKRLSKMAIQLGDVVISQFYDQMVELGPLCRHGTESVAFVDLIELIYRQVVLPIRHNRVEQLKQYDFTETPESLPFVERVLRQLNDLVDLEANRVEESDESESSDSDNLDEDEYEDTTMADE